MGTSHAVVVLGCAIVAEDDGRLTGAAARRAAAAARVFSRADDGAIVVASGGRMWGKESEADALARELVRCGVPEARIVKERVSLSTRDNARYTAIALRRRGIARVLLVTCAWHMPRAAALFRREGLDVEAFPADDAAASLAARVWRWGRERVAARLDGVAILALCLALGCSKGGPAPPGDAAALSPPTDFAAIARAEDQRRAKDVPETARTSHDVVTRRRAARALARIADPGSPLLAMLSDEDPEVVAWAAYGLGRACRSHEEAHVRALVARAASLGDPDADAGASSRAEVDPFTAIARAIGRCASPTSEPLLAAWVRARGGWAERAVFALGDVAARRNALTEETMTALLDAAEGGHEAAPLDAAVYPLGRLEHVSDAFVARAISAAKAVLARPGTARLFAIRALGRTGKDAAPELARVAADKSFGFAERDEAARALALLGPDGQAGIAEALARLVPDKDPFAIAALGGDEYGPMIALVAALGPEPPKRTQALFALARLEAPGTAPEPLARRLADLRCGAALALSRAAYDADLLDKCDEPGSEAWEKARLAALVRRQLVGERRTAWKALARSKSVRVKEQAIEAIAVHPELGDAARAVLAEALASKHAGLVASAAEILQAHPDRVLVLAASERKAALDPAAPPPTANPAREIDKDIAKALKDALANAWAEDLVETRANLLDAAAAVSLPGAREAAQAACKDPNVTMRDRAVKALRAMGDDKPACAAPDASGAPPLPKAIEKEARVVFQTDGGEVSIVLEPALAPITATRFVELARAGFFKGIVVHRVVPGFVVQLGDPGGDGYGGAGKLLRDETSPVPFGPLDVGVALAGRDTGSSQLFVTLARYPHLDGEYARIGRAEGDWAAIAQGDVVREVRVVE